MREMKSHNMVFRDWNRPCQLTTRYLKILFLFQYKIHSNISSFMANVQTQIEIPCPTILNFFFRRNLWVDERFRSGDGEETSDFCGANQKMGLKIELWIKKCAFIISQQKSRNFVKFQVTKTSSLCLYLSNFCIFHLSFSQNYSVKCLFQRIKCST